MDVADRPTGSITDRRAYPRVAVETSPVTDRRRRGRPRICNGPTARANTDIPVGVFDALCRQAQRARISLREHLRRILEQHAGPDIFVPKNRQADQTRAS